MPEIDDTTRQNFTSTLEEVCEIVGASGQLAAQGILHALIAAMKVQEEKELFNHCCNWLVERAPEWSVKAAQQREAGR